MIASEINIRQNSIEVDVSKYKQPIGLQHREKNNTV